MTFRALLTALKITFILIQVGNGRGSIATLLKSSKLRLANRQ